MFKAKASPKCQIKITAAHRYKSMFPACENIGQLKAWRREIHGDEKVNLYTCKYNETLTTTL